MLNGAFSTRVENRRERASVGGRSHLTRLRERLIRRPEHANGVHRISGDVLHMASGSERPS
jgi:hypothetical protein